MEEMECRIRAAQICGLPLTEIELKLDCDQLLTEGKLCICFHNEQEDELMSAPKACLSIQQTASQWR